jgi:hypothetical protein
MSTLSGGPNIVVDGLVFNVDAANVKSYPGSGTTWRDLSRGDNNGTLVNGPTYNTANGGSIVFDGVDDFVGSFTSLNLLNNITVSCWFSFINIPSGTSYRGIVGDWDTVNNTRSWLLTKFNTNNTISFFLNSTGISSNNININSTTLIVPNVKYYASGVYNGNTMSIYVNGVLENSTNYSSNIFQGTLLRLGNFSNTNFSNSNIYQTSIYNRALSAQEILQNYNTTKTRFGL